VLSGQLSNDCIPSNTATPDGAMTQNLGMIDSIQSVDVRVKGRWVSIPVMEVNGDKLAARGKWLTIAYVRGEEMREEGIGAPDPYLAALKRDAQGILKADIFSFTQKLPTTTATYPYPLEWESIAAIRLTSHAKWWEALPQETRKNVRRAHKRGVVVSVKEFNDDLIEGIRAVNNDSPVRQGRRNAYYGLSHEETRARYGEFVGRCDFLCAYSGQEMVGFLHLVYRGDVAAVLNLTAKPSHSDKRPANALMAEAVELCAARGVSHITYGLYNYGNKRDSSLKEFKIRNGFEEILVPRYYVPITCWGKLCIKAKVHRGLIGILPPAVIAAGLRMRSLWHALTYPRSRCSSRAERPNCNRQMESSNPPAGSTTSKSQ
jgi:hypothetical protein